MCFFPSIVRPVASIFSIDIERPPLGVFGVGQLAKFAAPGSFKKIGRDPSAFFGP